MPTEPAPHLSPTVAPVIDYEPPARATVPHRPTPAPLTPASGRPRAGHARRPRPDRYLRNPLPPRLQSAAAFADAALRRVLEVVDGRRPSTHLLPLLAAGLADTVTAARSPTSAGRAEPATLQRVRVQPVGSGEPTTAVEAFGTYRRGRRTHALACRIESVPRPGPGTSGTAWRIVALHIG